MSFHYFLPDPDLNEQIKLNYSSTLSSSSSSFSSSPASSSFPLTSYISSPSSILSSSRYENVKDQTDFQLNIPYTAFEILVGVIAVIGNLMVIIVFKRDRKLRRRTNYYIVSLAVADFLVGLLGVPFAILSSIGEPKNLYACLLSLSTLVVLCTISIFCLVAVSVDRYWAILHPMAYSRNVRTKTAIGIISMCWVAGTIVGLMPLFGFHTYQGTCFFEETMDYNFLLFLYFATIITPAFLMLCFYAHIYRVIVKQIRQIVTMNPISGSRRSSRLSVYDQQQVKTISNNTFNNCRGHGGTMLRVLGAARKRDVKATQNLSIIVLFFMICWIPLYTINCIRAFNRDIPIPDQLKMCCIILTHLNSAVNPILYAYHLKDFRAALKNLILKIFGIEVQQQPDIHYKLSIASQHRLHSISRASFRNRIYVDSPVWLKQKQIEEQNKTNLTITKSLNSVHQTVAAVASATTDREMWKIVEIPSIINEESYKLHSDCELSNSKSKNYISSDDDDDDDDREPSQISTYDNKNFSTSVDNLSHKLKNQKITMEPRKSITLALIRQQLKSSKSNYPPQTALGTELKQLDFLGPSLNSYGSLKAKQKEIEQNFKTSNEIKKSYSISSNSSNNSYTSSSSEDFIKHESYRKLDSNHLPPIYHISLGPTNTTTTEIVDIENVPKSSKFNSLKSMKRLYSSNDELDSYKARDLTNTNKDFNYRLYNSQPRKKLNLLGSNKIKMDNQLENTKHYSLFQICDYFKEKDDENKVELKFGRKRTLSSES
ncbi:uncharacterized protein LOC129618744 [Condylostylus longicornis]|uniref:uncharacterized protein LOC129618744 n=1 Tax=Condylostylus longicornis TaxID=2530218 RepID=UPI00244DC10B|nr:uncharacterized protein LOC129618744 [Condylostylus longicornis]